MAAAEPRTLAAAFRDQAQRTEGGWSFSRRRRPQGKGIPIRNAAGKIDAAVTAIFNNRGQPAAAASKGATPKASAATRTKIAPRMLIRSLSSRAIWRLK